MKIVSIEIIVLLFATLTIISQAQTTTKKPISAKKTGFGRCRILSDGKQVCFCGKNKLRYDRSKGERCINEQVFQQGNQRSYGSKPAGLRLLTKSIHQSTRDDNTDGQCAGLRFKQRSDEITEEYVPLQNVSVEAWIDTFAVDVTLTQVFVNKEENPIEAIYVFPIEENAAVYSFTAQIDDRTITAVLKEKKAAEKEYETAVEEGQTAVLMRQSEETLDTFTINVGALPPGKECRITIRYVTELDLIDGSSIRFVVPTTIAPRYNPSLGHLQNPDNTKSKYVQKTPYSMWFQAHIIRGEKYKIMHVANHSHPVNISISHQFIDVSSEAIALDRDIILDIDLPEKRPQTIVAVEQSHNSSKHAVLLAFTPRISDFIKISNGKEETATEFIFIVDCSGSMTEGNRISLAKEAMLLFIRSLPVGSHFNIIRFGSRFDILFQNETLTTVYDEQTAKKAEELTRSMAADFGGTELLEPLEHLEKNPPIKGRSRQIFLLTDGEISNTNEVIELCRSMSSTTRIFSFGLGLSPSRSLVKGLARATNGHFVFVPPNAKVDTYVGSQLGRALQPSIVNAQLKWHGLTTDGLQSPKTIPPLYVNDRVLVYELLEGDDLKRENISVDFMIGEHIIETINLSGYVAKKRDAIRRLAAKALIQELQHEKPKDDTKDDSNMKQRITALSITHQILSPYTAFVGVETTSPKNNNSPSKVRHVPIQISKGDEHLFSSQPFYSALSRGSMSYTPNQIPQAMSNHAPRGPPIAYGFFGSSRNHLHAGPQAQLQGSMAFDRAPLYTTTTTGVPLTTDPVRWLIDQQSFNGEWLLSEKDVEKLTNGKPLDMFRSAISDDKNVLTTALAIAILESKYADQKSLWYALVEKGRKRLYSFGLSNDRVNILINEIKNKL